MYYTTKPRSFEDGAGQVIGLLWFCVSAVAMGVMTTIPDKHDVFYTNFQMLYLCLLLLVTLVIQSDWARGVEETWLVTNALCCLLPVSGVVYLVATYACTSDKTPTEASLRGKAYPYSRLRSIGVPVLIWLGLTIYFVATVLFHPVSPPDVDYGSIEGIESWARFVATRLVTPLDVSSESSWALYLTRITANISWDFFLLTWSFFLDDVLHAPPRTGTPSADKAKLDIDKEQWVIDRRAKVAAEKGTRRALGNANAQISWHVALQGEHKAQLKQRAEAMDLQHKAIVTAVETRDRHAQTIATLKTQVAALEAKEKASSKVQAQLTGEKQHLLDALTNSQHAVQGVRGTLRSRDMELATLRAQLSHHHAQHKIDENQTKATSNARSDQAAKLAKELNEKKKILEASEATCAQRLRMIRAANARLYLIEQTMKSAGLPCDTWQVSSKELLAKLQGATKSARDHEAKLAETCSELSTANEQLKRDLSVSEGKLAQTTADFETAGTQHHAAFCEWQGSLSQAQQALAVARREKEDQVAALQTRVIHYYKDNTDLRSVIFDNEAKIRDLSQQFTTQFERTKQERECLDRCIRSNCELRKTLGVEKQRVKDLEARMEAADEARHVDRREIQRLTGILECQDGIVSELEETNETLEKKLVLGDEFVEVTDKDARAAAECARQEDEVVFVQENEAHDSSDEFEDFDVDEDGEGLETVNSILNVRVQ